MLSRVRIDVACNDPDNGLFDRVARGIQFGEIELEPDCWDGYTFSDLGCAIRIHRRKFRVVGSKDWIGNWCWNGYLLERAEAKRLIATLRNSGRWRCTHGPCRWFDWFNREGRFA